jgi:hypothetical protein
MILLCFSSISLRRSPDSQVPAVRVPWSPNLFWSSSNSEERFEPRSGPLRRVVRDSVEQFLACGRLWYAEASKISADGCGGSWGFGAVRIQFARGP